MLSVLRLKNLATFASTGKKYLSSKSFPSAGVQGPYGPNGHPFFHQRKKGGAKVWMAISLFVALPTVVVMSVKVLGEAEEERICREMNRPKFIPYDHLRIRTKRFPWGDGNKTFFHNPKLNALPDGYEDGGDEEEETEEETGAEAEAEE